MKRYIALLRGINVGGKNTISMSELKTVFEEIGFENVKTYINSGNVLFSSDRNEDDLRILCEKAIQKQFQLNITVLIISMLNLIEALDSVPYWFNKDKTSKNNVIFVIHPLTSDDILNQYNKDLQKDEHFYSYKNIIFWSVPLKTFSKTKFSRISNTSLYNNITIRNANTAIALSKMN